MDRFVSVLPFLACAAIAAVLIALLFPVASPLGGVRLPLSPPEIQQRSDSLLALIGVDMTGMTSQATFAGNQSLLEHLAGEDGVRGANSRVMGGVPGFFWKVTWRKLENLEALVGSSSDNKESTKEVLDFLRGEVSITVDPSGHLLGFERAIPDTVALVTLGADSARALARSFVERAVPDSERPALDWAKELRSVSESSQDQPGHRQYRYLWSGVSRSLGTRTEAELVVAGNMLRRFEVRYVVPPGVQSAPGMAVGEILIILVYVVLIIGMIVSAIRIIRAYELGFRLAIVAGVIVALAVGYQVFLEMRGFGARQLVSLLLGPLFSGGAMLLLWAVAESVTRESSREKLVPLDLATHGYLFHSMVGKSAVQGIASGLAAYACLLAGISVLGELTAVRFGLTAEKVADAFPSQMPLLSVSSNTIVLTLFVFVLFVLFGVSWLRARLPWPLVAVAVSASVLGANNFERLEPLWPAIGIQALAFFIVAWTFYRYDVLAGILALWTYLLIPRVVGFIVSGNSFFEVPALLYVAGTAVVLAGGAAMQFRRQELSSFEEIAPAFARNITERQRLQQELEIARRVQMSFLPKHNPTVEGLDIAAQCIPAQEVGGDYFDFIELGPGKLGIAIGDVSGKGTQAAFFMTLAKGFLKALSPHHDSPAEVLSHLNKLFYESVERGAFISMVYATIDVTRRTLVIARAGHNPVIMRKSEAVDVEVLQPQGLGLGLEAGETFSKTIEEVSVPVTSGDTFVFYTDGFSEAMNKERLEFGEEQLYTVVNTVSGGTAQHILDEVFAAVRQFAGKEKQHDDMTLVVLKIK